MGEFVWSKQCDILNSIVKNRKTAVPSCHESGKSFIAARATAWWIDSHPPGEAFVVTSASTASQVRAVLWREIGKAHALGKLQGRVNQTEWHIKGKNGNEEMVAFGRKPSEYDPTAFQGIHARHVLVIFDEAGGIAGGSAENPDSLWESADSLIANDNGRFLAIGQPSDPNSEFAKVCAPGSGWNVIPISAFDTPNFTAEVIPDLLREFLIGSTYVDEKRKQWGEDNPLWKIKVLGRFPENSTDGLIPYSWIRAAQDRNLVPCAPIEFGVDVGGGSDKNVIAKRSGPVVRIIRRNQEPDTMKSCGNMIIDIRNHNATIAKIDYIGIGRGMTDRAKELAQPVRGINVGLPAKNKQGYKNIRAEGYWALRERFQVGDIDIDPEDSDLAAQLADIKWFPTSSGQVQIESKDEIRRRGKASPDDADAVMLAFLPEHLCGPQPVRNVEVQWG
jgi:hypothetical protein